MEKNLIPLQLHKILSRDGWLDSFGRSANFDCFADLRQM